ncbi:hypothetical protein GTQ45_10810 [Pyruvatibacter mobilis]|uniref:Uncharacterized protein n=1 Tax=Pyruvatibacter mobilis TaxID=1712261 RepID=A0A845QCA5_9HYPH|nr:hypothetical protein [Pyruvatibacter mobilis]NBG96222.1 hypothetical protein [Pyruvatibacter mobilis]QJD75726.1 hypothetical protein HG718_10065 [Pyruvatibacter mobilis]GGD18059.1 hypothetical protein GCM10011587_22970 [Pyruvatibacter mobilis]
MEKILIQVAWRDASQSNGRAFHDGWPSACAGSARHMDAAARAINATRRQLAVRACHRPVWARVKD